MAYPVDHVVDTTGCGNSFASGLVFGFGRFGAPFLATQYANLLGAMRTQAKTFDVFQNFEMTENLRSSYHEPNPSSLKFLSVIRLLKLGLAGSGLR